MSVINGRKKISETIGTEQRLYVGVTPEPKDELTSMAILSPLSELIEHDAEAKTKSLPLPLSTSSSSARRRRWRLHLAREENALARAANLRQLHARIGSSVSICVDVRLGVTVRLVQINR